MNRRQLLTSATAGLATAFIPGAGQACHRRRMLYTNQSQYYYDTSLAVARNEITEYAGVYVPELYYHFESSLFALRATGNLHNVEGVDLIERQIVPDLRQRRISHKRNEWQIIGAWNYPVVLCERRLSQRTWNDRVLFVTARTATNTGPGPNFPLFVRLAADREREYGDGEAWVSLWDHTVRIRSFQSGPNSGAIHVLWEEY